MSYILNLVILCDIASVCSGIFPMSEMYNCEVDELVHERRNSIANTLELRFSCTNPSK